MDAPGIDEAPLLVTLRRDRAAWPQVACVPEPEVGAEGEQWDANEETRYSVLSALLADRQPGDYDLIAYLFEQEIESRKHYEGVYDESLHLAAYLLAEFRRVESVWLFIDAKLANFDTWCGFDREYLLSAGVAPTLAYIQQSTDPRRAKVLELVMEAGATKYSEADLTRWRIYKQQYYSDLPPPTPD